MKPLRFFSLIALTAFCCFATSASFADQNASGGGILNSEAVVLGAGPFNHGAGVGDLSNTIVNPTFVGGFNANRVRFQGLATSVAAGTFASEADIRITLGANFFNWQNPGPTTYTTFAYNNPQTLTGALLNANPAGLWAVEFFDSADDAAGTDSTSTNVTMTFENIVAITDFNGLFTAGALASGVQYLSQGEFAVPQTAGANGNNDRYSFSIGQSGFLDVGTTDTPGFTGLVNGDTEIGIFDSLGNIVPNAFDDDTGVGNYSLLNQIFLTAGSYTLVIGDFNTNFTNTSNLGNLTFGAAPAAGYDYGVNMLFSAVPEPSSLAVLGLMGVVLGFRRKRS